MTPQCLHCGTPLSQSRKNPNQKFCGARQCQWARKRQWQKYKMATDPAYRQNQKQANQQWQKRNPSYWKNYRENHQEYAKRNRENSRQRMTIKRQVASILTEFAKMDASLVDHQALSGYCLLIPVGEMFAKMDAKFLKLNISREDRDQDPSVCKERTVSSP